MAVSARSQLISVYPHPFRRTSLFCSQKSHNHKILYFLGSRSGKVIDVIMLTPLISTSPVGIPKCGNACKLKQFLSKYIILYNIIILYFLSFWIARRLILWLHVA